MTPKAKAESLKKYAKEQMAKSQEILQTIRTHHGSRMGDGATLVTNMMVHQQQLETLLMALLRTVADQLPADNALASVVRLTGLTDAAMEQIERGHDIPAAMFQLLFTETERDALAPFMDQLKDNIGAITKNILAATE